MHTDLRLSRPVLPIITTLFAAVFTAVVMAEELLICPACRREAPPGAQFCPRCGTAIATSTAPSVPVSPTTPEGPGDAPAAPGSALTPSSNASATPSSMPVAAPGPSGAFSATLAAEAVKGASEAALACARAGREQFAAGQPETARLLYANALAIASLDAGVLTPEQGHRILAEIRRCDDRLASILAECQICHGSGRASMQVTSLAGPAGVSQSSVSSTVRCQACGGSGRSVRRRTIAERKTSQGLGAKTAEAVFRSLSLVPEGGAWVPPAILPALDIRQRSRLRNAAADPCRQCRGLGLADCRKCGSTGQAPCKAKGCQNGWIVEESVNQLDSKSASIKRRIPCPDCGGSAHVPCAECQGRGTLVCTACGGSGERGPCPSCGGEGVAACHACGGTGRDRKSPRDQADAPCRVCGGTGLDFCRACHGDGHATR